MVVPGQTEIGGWASAPRLSQRDPARDGRGSLGLGEERAAGPAAGPVQSYRGAAFPPEGLQSSALLGLRRGRGHEPPLLPAPGARGRLRGAGPEHNTQEPRGIRAMPAVFFPFPEMGKMVIQKKKAIWRPSGRG